MAEEYLESITDQLPEMDVVKLGILMEKFQIPIKEAKKGKKGAMMSAVIQFINRTDLQTATDEGEAELQQIDAEVGKILKTQIRTTDDDEERAASASTNVVKIEDATETVETRVNSQVAADKSSGDAGIGLLRGLKLREFKLSGAVGTEEGCIDYQQLTYQIQQGREDGYTFKEVMHGVIKAIKNPTMKKFFQGKAFGKTGKKLTEESFNHMLRSKYMVQDSQKFYNLMVAARQEPGTSEMDFLHRMINLRDTVIEMSVEEGVPCNEENLQKKFLETLSVGFSSNNIRLDLRQVLKSEAVDDDELLEEVGLTMQREKAYQDRFGSNAGKCAKVHSIGTGKKDDGENTLSVAESQILAEIKNLNVKVDEVGKVSKRVDRLAGDVDDLKLTVAKIVSITTPAGGASPFPVPTPLQPIPAVGGRSRYRIKCQACEQQRIYCKHCNVCGQGGHKRKDCPTLNPNA